MPIRNMSVDALLSESAVAPNCVNIFKFFSVFYELHREMVIWFL